MNKSTVKDFFREIKRSFSRFIAILLIVLVGVAFFVGIKSTATDMRYSLDQKLNEFNIMDIWVLSTLGITENDIAAISELDGVESVEGGYFVDAVTSIDLTEFVFRVHNLGANDEETINQYSLVDGRFPERSGEAVVCTSTPYYDSPGIGDTLKLSSGTSEALTDSALVRDDYTIVGVVNSPYYVAHDKGTCDIGSGIISYYILVPDEDFQYTVYTEAKIKLSETEGLHYYDSAYKSIVDDVKNTIGNISVDLIEARLNEVKSMANEELSKAQGEYDQAKIDYDNQIADGQVQLQDAYAQIETGWSNLELEKENAATRIAEAETEIKDGEKQLAEAKQQYNESKAAYDSAMENYGDTLDQINELTESMNGAIDEANASAKEIEDYLAANPDLDAETRSEMESTLSSLYSIVDTSNQMAEPINQLNTDAQNLVDSAEKQLADAEVQIATAEKDLADGKKQLEESKKEAEEKFAEAEAELNDAQLQYDEAYAEFEKAKLDGEQQLQDARDQLIRAEAEIDRISEPTWYILDRNSVYGIAQFNNTANQMNDIAKIFPVFFYFVAALVCLTTMTRMVDEQRSSIGSYRALGYGNATIMLKYIFYAAIASLLGGVLGAIIGSYTFPSVIYYSYELLFDLPEFKIAGQYWLIAISILIGVFVTTFAAFYVCRSELKSEPATLLRPKAPPAGKKILVEKIPFIWNKCSFSVKVTLRNIFRYKKRFFMTVIGITGCCALLVAGFGISDSISSVVVNQFEELMHYDLALRLKTDFTFDNRNEIQQMLEEDETVSSYLSLSTNYCTMYNGDYSNESVTLYVANSSEELNNYYTLRDCRTEAPLSLTSDGIVICELLADNLGVSVGDSVTVKTADGLMRSIPVSGISENYVYLLSFMSQEAYESIFHFNAEENSFFVMLDNTSLEKESALGTKLNKTGFVATTEYFSTAVTSFEDNTAIFDRIVYVIILAAGLLAFIVLYNLTNINIVERTREIATIKVLGFYNKEVRNYVFRENVILTVFGAFLGLFVGIFLHSFIMTSLAQDLYMFGDKIDFSSFLLSFFITIVFGLIVNLAMRHRLRTIPMVESLKSIE